MNSKLLVAGAVVVVGAIAVWQFGGDLFSTSTDSGKQSTMSESSAPSKPVPAPKVSVNIPKLGQIARLGKEDFENNCAACHGENAAGTENGPSFINNIYRPAHHADFAFQRAVDLGVRAHHWRFGNMPPQTHVTKQELARIVVYIRELQQANGVK